MPFWAFSVVATNVTLQLQLALGSVGIIETPAMSVANLLQWHHYAFSLQNDATFFVDGIEVYHTAISTPTYNGTAGKQYVAGVHVCLL